MMNWYEYEVREDKSDAESKQQQTTSNQPAADKQIYQRIRNFEDPQQVLIVLVWAGNSKIDVGFENKSLK